MPAQRNTDGVIVNADDLHVDEVVGDRVLCPACGDKVFEHWPFGWDAHSAHRCGGIGGANVKSRKEAYKERFGHLFRLRRGVVAVLGPLLLAGLAGCGDGSSKTSGITADELRGRIVGEDFSPKQKFYDLYGEPERVSDIGDKTYLYYTCKDGKVVIECPKGPFQYDDDLAPLSVDRQ